MRNRMAAMHRRCKRVWSPWARNWPSKENCCCSWSHFANSILNNDRYSNPWSARWCSSNRLEVEVRAPYVNRWDDTVSREAGIPGATEGVYSASGMHMGDVEFGARYQLNDGGVDTPFYIGTLRFKSRTGKDPFDVVSDCVQRCVDNASGTGLPLDLPTGSGFNSVQAGLTVLYPSDPALAHDVLEKYLADTRCVNDNPY